MLGHLQGRAGLLICNTEQCFEARAWSGRRHKVRAMTDLRHCSHSLTSIWITRPKSELRSSCRGPRRGGRGLMPLARIRAQAWTSVAWSLSSRSLRVQPYIRSRDPESTIANFIFLKMKKPRFFSAAWYYTPLSR